MDSTGASAIERLVKLETRLAKIPSQKPRLPSFSHHAESIGKHGKFREHDSEPLVGAGDDCQDRSHPAALRALICPSVVCRSVETRA